jgi:hypothetical protein
MSKFVTKTVEGIIGKKKYEQLVILPDSADIMKIDLATINGIWDEYQRNMRGRSMVY